MSSQTPHADLPLPPYYNIPSLRHALRQIVQAIEDTFNSRDASAHMANIEPQFRRVIANQQSNRFCEVLNEDEYLVVWYFMWEWQEFQNHPTSSEAEFVETHRAIALEAGLWTPQEVPAAVQQPPQYMAHAPTAATPALTAGQMARAPSSAAGHAPVAPAVPRVARAPSPAALADTPNPTHQPAPNPNPQRRPTSTVPTNASTRRISPLPQRAKAEASTSTLTPPAPAPHSKKHVIQPMRPLPQLKPTPKPRDGSKYMPWEDVSDTDDEYVPTEEVPVPKRKNTQGTSSQKATKKIKKEGKMGAKESDTTNGDADDVEDCADADAGEVKRRPLPRPTGNVFRIPCERCKKLGLVCRMRESRTGETGACYPCNLLKVRCHGHGADYAPKAITEDEQRKMAEVPADDSNPQSRPAKVKSKPVILDSDEVEVVDDVVKIEKAQPSKARPLPSELAARSLAQPTSAPESDDGSVIFVRQKPATPVAAPASQPKPSQHRRRASSGGKHPRRDPTHDEDNDEDEPVPNANADGADSAADPAPIADADATADDEADAPTPTAGPPTSRLEGMMQRIMSQAVSTLSEKVAAAVADINTRNEERWMRMDERLNEIVGGVNHSHRLNKERTETLQTTLNHMGPWLLDAVSKMFEDIASSPEKSVKASPTHGIASASASASVSTSTLAPTATPPTMPIRPPLLAVAVTVATPQSSQPVADPSVLVPDVGQPADSEMHEPQLASSASSLAPPSLPLATNIVPPEESARPPSAAPIPDATTPASASNRPALLPPSENVSQRRSVSPAIVPPTAHVSRHRSVSPGLVPAAQNVSRRSVSPIPHSRMRGSPRLLPASPRPPTPPARTTDDDTVLDSE